MSPCALAESDHRIEDTGNELNDKRVQSNETEQGERESGTRQPLGRDFRATSNHGQEGSRQTDVLYLDLQYVLVDDLQQASIDHTNTVRANLCSKQQTS